MNNQTSVGQLSAVTRKADYRLSIVVPVFNEEATLPPLIAAIDQHVGSITHDYEIVLVDDGSRDQSFTVIEALAAQHPQIKGLSLSRNTGHQVALACGLESATGDIVVTMDADLQHPPALIPAMVAEWHKGFDIVNTVRQRTAPVPLVEGLLSRLFYVVFNRVSEVRLIPDSADFRLLDRACVDALNSMPERLKFFRGMVPYIGFSQTTLTFDCPPRTTGERSYTLRQSLRLASNGILSFSTIGLKLPFLLGLLILAITFVYLVVATLLLAFGVVPIERGWTSMVALLLLGMGLEMTFLGMFGLYLGKLFIEIKRRPLYFVRRTVNIGTRANAIKPD